MAHIGFQGKLEIQDGAASAWVVVANTITVTLPAEEYGEAEVTQLNQVDGSSAPDPVRRFIPTLEDPGMLKCETHFTKAEYLRFRLLKGVVKNYRITPPDEDGAGAVAAVVLTGPGFLKKLDEIQLEKDVPVKVKFEVRRTAAWASVA